MAKSKSRFAPGSHVGPYELVRLLGRGGMGSVHEARVGDEIVAIKLLPAYNPQEGLDPRFRREAEALRTLSHSAIVPILDVGVDATSRTPYLVMELLEGDDLDSVIVRAGRLAPENVIAIGLDVGRALAHAHRHNVVHRDIKPANVFLPRDVARGRAIVCDFGLAKRTDLVASLTETGALLGTPHYMSPEQFLDAKRVDARTDVWSLGMTLLHALVGVHPLDGVDDPGQIMIRLCTVPIPDARDMLAGVPDAVAEALAVALVTDPRRRGSLAELLAALEVAESSLPKPSARRPAPDVATTRRTEAARPAAATLALGNGTYRVGESDGPAVFEGTDGDARSVRLERFDGLAARDEGRTAFAEEMLALGSLLSESIVAVLDGGRIGDDAWLVTEPREGPDLRTFVDETGPVAYLPALRAFLRLSRGLAALGDAGIVHGSIRPEALHVREARPGDSTLVLHDLGVARRLEAFMADPRASSPPKRRAPDLRTDVVGVVASLSFALTGVLPFRGRDKLSLRGDELAKGGAGIVEKRALEELLRRAMAGEVPSLLALWAELRTLAGEPPHR